jgi:hypothetical protein
MSKPQLRARGARHSILNKSRYTIILGKIICFTMSQGKAIILELKI